MAKDSTEQFRRGQSSTKKTTKELYAAIEHRVIDSSAFAALRPSSVLLLLLMTRQLTKDNNGHLHAAFKWCSKYGIGSEHTLRDAIAQLIAHGMIYRTRSHGANGAWARYAVTWLPIKKRDDLFLAGYKPCAWRDWKPLEKKSTRQNVQEQSGRNCSFTHQHPAESAGSRGAESADNELMPCRSVKVPLYRRSRSKRHRLLDHSISPRPLYKSGREFLRLLARKEFQSCQL
jgi:hypothetical protein